MPSLRRSLPLPALLLVLLCALLLLPTTAQAGCDADLPGEGEDDHAADTGMCTAPPPAAASKTAASASSSSAAGSEWVSSSATLARIRARGFLVCAHIDDTLGHSKVRSETDADGMEPELCKGLSAALGLTTGPRFHVMRAPAERFPLLQSGAVDVALSLTSKTIGRDLLERGSFSVPYFHDQHSLMVRSDSGINSGATLAGKTVCATAGTTNPNVLGDYIATLRASGDLRDEDKVDVRLVDDDVTALRLMREGECDAFVNDESVVAGYVHSEPAPGAGVKYVLAHWPGTPFARAPFSAVTLDGDAEWSAIVDWFVQGLFLAEMYGVTASNVADEAFLRTLPGEAQRLLGLQPVGGVHLPLDMRAVVATIGNYAELYDRNFGAFFPRSKANMLYQDGGAIFPGGFR